MKKGSFIKDAFILFAITLVLGFLLSIVKNLTDIPIKRANEEAKKRAYSEVCVGYNSSDDVTNDYIDAVSGNADVTSVLIAKDSNNQNLGYIIQLTTKGYGGDIEVIVGFDNNKNVTGIAFPTALQETPGLGMRITEEPFKSSFNGKNGSNISTVDTLSGATISSSAVKGAITMATQIVDKM